MVGQVLQGTLGHCNPLLGRPSHLKTVVVIDRNLEDIAIITAENLAVVNRSDWKEAVGSNRRCVHVVAKEVPLQRQYEDSPAGREPLHQHGPREAEEVPAGSLHTVQDLVLVWA